jgi:ring-1,2-phenylacetyl-CoA epoxidase subunit PaaE
MLNFFKKTAKKKDSLIATEKGKGRAKFHNLRVQDITRETADCVSVAFEIPEALEAEYKFLPGQYLTLEAEIEGTKVRRSYSLCSSPVDGELRVAIKMVEQGAFSTWANEKLTVGSEMRVMTPEGNFFVKPSATPKNYVGFAAGSGITPVYSILKSVLELEPGSTFKLFYGNQTSNTVIFRDKIDALKNTYMNRLEVHHVLSREDQGTDLLKGRIDAEKCSSFAERFFEPGNIDGYFLCGPEGMINSVSETLHKLGVAKDKVHFELFTSPAQSIAGKTKVSVPSDQDKGAQSAITVILDGDETHFPLKKAGFSILDAALDAGADVPYACKGAVCCTCRAKVLEGSVEMDMNYALEDDEVEDGYVLTCQSHPTSEKVVVSFDE